MPHARHTVLLCLSGRHHLVEAAVVQAGGETSERQWADVLSVINVQADALDKVYLEHETGTLNLSDLLKKASTEAQGQGD